MPGMTDARAQLSVCLFVCLHPVLPCFYVCLSISMFICLVCMWHYNLFVLSVYYEPQPSLVRNELLSLFSTLCNIVVWLTLIFSLLSFPKQPYKTIISRVIVLDLMCNHDHVSSIELSQRPCYGMWLLFPLCRNKYIYLCHIVLLGIELVSLY